MPPITANNNIDNIAIVTMFLPPKCQKYFGFYSIIYDVFLVKNKKESVSQYRCAPPFILIRYKQLVLSLRSPTLTS